MKLNIVDVVKFLKETEGKIKNSEDISWSKLNELFEDTAFQKNMDGVHSFFEASGGSLTDIDQYIALNSVLYVYELYLAKNNMGDRVNNHLLTARRMKEWRIAGKDNLIARDVIKTALYNQSSDFMDVLFEEKLIELSQVKVLIRSLVEERKRSEIDLLVKLAMKHKVLQSDEDPANYPLINAIKNKDIQFVKLLLGQAGYDVNARCKTGETCLHLAMKISINSYFGLSQDRDDFELAKLLLEKGADPGQLFQNISPIDLLHHAENREQLNRKSRDFLDTLTKQYPAHLHYKKGSKYVSNKDIFIADIPAEKLLVALVKNVNPNSHLTEEQAKKLLEESNDVIAAIDNVELNFCFSRDFLISTKDKSHHKLSYDNVNFTYYNNNAKTAVQVVETLRIALREEMQKEMQSDEQEKIAKVRKLFNQKWSKICEQRNNFSGHSECNYGAAISFEAFRYDCKQDKRCAIAVTQPNQFLINFKHADYLNREGMATLARLMEPFLKAPQGYASKEDKGTLVYVIENSIDNVIKILESSLSPNKFLELKLRELLGHPCDDTSIKFSINEDAKKNKVVIYVKIKEKNMQNGITFPDFMKLADKLTAAGIAPIRAIKQGEIAASAKIEVNGKVSELLSKLDLSPLEPTVNMSMQM